MATCGFARARQSRSLRLSSTSQTINDTRSFPSPILPTTLTVSVHSRNDCHPPQTTTNLLRSHVLIDQRSNLRLLHLAGSVEREVLRPKAFSSIAPPSAQSGPNISTTRPARSSSLLPLKLWRIAMASWPKVGCDFPTTTVCGPAMSTSSRNINMSGQERLTCDPAYADKHDSIAAGAIDTAALFTTSFFRPTMYTSPLSLTTARSPVMNQSPLSSL